MAIIKTISIKQEHENWLVKKGDEVSLSKICQKAIEREMKKK